ncbi:MAG: PadR family transcriptional regulator [Polyangiaceae bacterium]|nr:PadR family transcriptional regulator [Polyangiaceae bacterium]
MQDDLHKEASAWRSQLRKGTLELAVLLLLRRGRRYGLEIVDVLNEAGLGISEGSIYPLLSRLKAEKKVTTEWVQAEAGHAHKYYELTDHGRQTCSLLLEAWRDYVAAFDRLAGKKG